MPPSGHRPPPPQPPPPKANQRLLSLLLKALIMTLITSLFFVFLGVVAIILLHLCLAGRAFHRRRNYHHSTPDSSSGLSPQQLKTLPQFRFGATTTTTQQTDCVVCLEDFRNGQWCRKIAGCNHVFHRRCVDTWLLKVPACPICRSRVRMNLGISSSFGVPEDYKHWWGDGRSGDLRIR